MSWQISVLGVERLRDVELSERNSHLFVAKTDRTPFVTFFNPALPRISSVVNKYTTLLQSTANRRRAFPSPPVIAYRRNASLHDPLVHSQEFKNARTHATSLILFS